MSGWWERASTEDRLAQIDGGIEAGLSSLEIAKIVGAPIYHDGKSNAAHAFGSSHGRRFSRVNVRANGRRGGLAAGILNARRRGVADSEISSAFDLFDAPHHQDRFIDVLPGER